MSTSIGSQVQRPLATVVVGGMLIGPLMLSSSCQRFERRSWTGAGAPAAARSRYAEAALRTKTDVSINTFAPKALQVGGENMAFTSETPTL
jgi:hypothetical protein